MDKEFLQDFEKFQDELFLFLGLSLNEVKNNSRYSSWELILAFSVDAYRGGIGSAKNASFTGIVRAARSLFEIYMDSELISKASDNQSMLDDFKLYAMVETRKLKIIHGLGVSLEEEAVAKKFENENNNIYKHWSRINSVEGRAKKLGGSFSTTYDSFYRISSLAVHGSSSFGIFYKDSLTYNNIMKDYLTLSVSFVFGVIENCISATVPVGSDLESSFKRLETLKKNIII